MNRTFIRLTGVELRKMVDTRAGFWLQLIVAVVTLAAIVIICLIADGDEVSFRDLLGIAITPASILLPIVGILLVTSEWSQRTGMITFALVPLRNAMPAAPPIGALSDIISFFWAEIIVAVCLVAGVVTWLKRGSVDGKTK